MIWKSIGMKISLEPRQRSKFAYDRRMAEEEVEMMKEEAFFTAITTLKSIEETFEGHDIDAPQRIKTSASLTDGSTNCKRCRHP